MANVDSLYDSLVRHPDDSCKHNIMKRTGLNEPSLDAAKRRLRTIFQADDITLVFERWDGEGCDIDGCNTVFRLIGTFDGAATHLAHGVATVEGGIDANLKILDPLIRPDQPRTLEERKARLMHKSLTRLSEDIGDLRAELQP